MNTTDQDVKIALGEGKEGIYEMTYTLGLIEVPQNSPILQLTTQTHTHTQCRLSLYIGLM